MTIVDPVLSDLATTAVILVFIYRQQKVNTNAITRLRAKTDFVVDVLVEHLSINREDVPARGGAD